MIIETTTGVQNDPYAFLDKQLVAIAFDPTTKMGAIQLVANSEFMRVNMPYDELLEIFKDSQSRDYFTDEVKRNSEQKKFDEVIIGAHKFRVDIRIHEYADGKSQTLCVYANFELINPSFREILSHVIGVDDKLTNGYPNNRYELMISIGKMFDPEKVRQDLEDTIKNYLSE